MKSQQIEDRRIMGNVAKTVVFWVAVSLLLVIMAVIIAP